MSGPAQSRYQKFPQFLTASRSHKSANQSDHILMTTGSAGPPLDKTLKPSKSANTRLCKSYVPDSVRRWGQKHVQSQFGKSSALWSFLGLMVLIFSQQSAVLDFTDTFGLLLDLPVFMLAGALVLRLKGQLWIRVIAAIVLILPGALDFEAIEFDGIETESFGVWLIYGYGPRLDAITIFSAFLLFLPLQEVKHRSFLAIPLFALIAGFDAYFDTTDMHGWRFRQQWAAGLLVSIFYVGGGARSLITIIALALAGTLLNVSAILEPSDRFSVGFDFDYGLHSVVAMTLLAWCLFTIREVIWRQRGSKTGLFWASAAVAVAAGLGDLMDPINMGLNNVADNISELFSYASDSFMAHAQDASSQEIVVVTGSRFLDETLSLFNPILFACLCFSVGLLKPSQWIRSAVILVFLVALSQLVEGIYDPFDYFEFAHQIQIHEYLAAIIFVAMGATFARRIKSEPTEGRRPADAVPDGAFLAPERPRNGWPRWSILPAAQFHELRKRAKEAPNTVRDIVADADQSPLRVKLSEVFYASRGAVLLGVVLVTIYWVLHAVTQGVSLTTRAGISAILSDVLTSSFAAFVVPTMFLIIAGIASASIFPLGLKGATNLRTVRQLYLVVDGTTGYRGQTLAAYASVFGWRVFEMIDPSTGDLKFTDGIMQWFSWAVAGGYVLFTIAALIILLPVNLILVPFRTSKQIAQIAGIRRVWSLIVHALATIVSGYIISLFLGSIVVAIMYGIPFLVRLFI